MEDNEARWGSVSGRIVPAVTINLPADRAKEMKEYLEEQSVNLEANSNTAQWEVWAVLDDLIPDE